MLSITLAGAVQVGLNTSFSFTDLTNVQAPLSKVIPTLLANMNAASFGQAILSTTPSPVTLPANPTQLLYAMNMQTGKIGSTNTITITWTPVGSSSAVIMTLQPQAVLFFFNPANGISALSVVASGPNTIVDYTLAG